MCHNDSLTQFTWSRPQSSKLLFEGGGTVGLNTYGTANFGTKSDGSDYQMCGQSQPFLVNIADPARGPSYHGVGAIGAGDVSNRFQRPLRDVVCDRLAQREGGFHDPPGQRVRQHDPRGQ